MIHCLEEFYQRHIHRIRRHGRCLDCHWNNYLHYWPLAVYSLIKSRFTGGIPSISPTSWTRSFIFDKILRSTSRPVAWSLLPPYLFYSQKVCQKQPKSCLPSTGRTALSKHKSYFSLFIPILLEPEHKPFDARKKA